MGWWSLLASMEILGCSKPWVYGRERVLFIGIQFSILYTSMYSPAEAATTRPIGDLIPTIRGSGAHPGRGKMCPWIFGLFGFYWHLWIFGESLSDEAEAACWRYARSINPLSCSADLHAPTAALWQSQSEPAASSSWRCSCSPGLHRGDAPIHRPQPRQCQWSWSSARSHTALCTSAKARLSALAPAH